MNDKIRAQVFEKLDKQNELDSLSGELPASDDRNIWIKLADGSWWLAVQRSFLASCSSVWSYGCVRYPGAKMPRCFHPEPGIDLGGPADIWDELGYKCIADGIHRTIHRYETHEAMTAGNFITINIDLIGLYRDGYEISSSSLHTLQHFDEYISGHLFNQCAYEVIMKHNDSAIMIAEYDEKWLGYLRRALTDLGKEFNVGVGIDSGDIFYINADNIVSEGINRSWLNMKAIAPGTILFDEHFINYYGVYASALGYEGSLCASLD